MEVVDGDGSGRPGGLGKLPLLKLMSRSSYRKFVSAVLCVGKSEDARLVLSSTTSRALFPEAAKQRLLGLGSRGAASVVFCIYCVTCLHQRSAEGDYGRGAHEGVEACDLTVRSMRTGEPLGFRIDDCATQKKRCELLVRFWKIEDSSSGTQQLLCTAVIRWLCLGGEVGVVIGGGGIAGAGSRGLVLDLNACHCLPASSTVSTS